MAMLDWAIVAVILISTLISIWRGAVREIFSLATWILAALVGFKFNTLLVPFYSAFTTSETLQLVGSFLTLVILVLVIGTIIGVAISSAISKMGLGVIDRVLGLGFGCARGILIVSVIVLFLGQTEVPSEPWWKDSTLLPQFEKVAEYINDWIKAQGFEPFGAQTKTA
jgi:membrane protein required for colicin V production